MSKIANISGLEVLDSRGNPTVMASISLTSGENATAMAPSGASTGKFEAYELRDKDQLRYGGKGTQKAVANIDKVIAPLLEGKDPLDQKAIDQLLCQADGTPNKSSLGANAILATSLSVARVSAALQKKPLFLHINHIFESSFGVKAPLVMPKPMVNIINGGSHADNALDFQEFMIQPINPPDFTTGIRWCSEIFHSLGRLLRSKKLSTNVGDEGGFAPQLASHEEALNLILEAIENAGKIPGEDIALCLDCASSEFYSSNAYLVEGKKVTNSELIANLESLVTKYPIVSIEDALDQEDESGWQELTANLGNKVQLVGDDLFATNPELLAKGIAKNLANAILIKLNQIGTLSETFEVMKMAYSANFPAVVSHRSGETEDTFIADLAVGTGSGQIKTGSLSRTDRVAKYNRLLWMESFLRNKDV